MHSKAILIDNQLLIIGSQNMHYSSFGENGLTEFSLATESPEAIEAFQQTFEFYWERSLPVEEGSKPTTQ
jgi:cardiolipin synthase